jgi:hypothetical protein
MASLLVCSSVNAVSPRDTEIKKADVKHGRHLLQRGGGGNVQPPPPPIIDIETSFSFASGVSFSMSFDNLAPQSMSFAQSMSFTNECVDSTTWFFEAFPARTCEIVAIVPGIRCDWIGDDGTIARDSCPVACDAC